MTPVAARFSVVLLMLAAALPVVRPASGAMTTVSAPAPPRYHKIRAVDADNHWVQLNRPGVVTIVVGTSEDSQEAARQAGTTMYPFEGRPGCRRSCCTRCRRTWTRRRWS
jgi:hypothetical protein